MLDENESLNFILPIKWLVKFVMELPDQFLRNLHDRMKKDLPLLATHFREEILVQYRKTLEYHEHQKLTSERKRNIGLIILKSLKKSPSAKTDFSHKLSIIFSKNRF